MADTPASAPPAATPSAPASGELGPSIAPRAAPQSPAPAQRVTPTPGSKAWAEQPADQRHAQLRGPANPRARGHSPALEQREAAARGSSGEPTPAADQQQPPADAGAKVKVGKYAIDETRLGEMMTRQAAEDLRTATRPATPEAYEARLPEGLKLPGNMEYRFNAADPSLVAARNMAHAKGWSQQDFSDALGIFASHIAGEQAALAERSRQELSKVGVNATQRIDAVGKFLDGFMGTADAVPIKATLVTDSHLRFVEAVMQKLTSQGSASFSQSHRVPADTEAIPNYANMSFEQRRFAQDQAAARRRGR